jgi:hypothetical protein
MAAARWPVAVVLIAPTVASADSTETIRDAAVFSVDRTPVLDASIGLEAGDFSVGPGSLFANGFAVDAGVRLDRLSLLGTYSRLLLSPDGNSADDGAAVASLHRFGVAARYDLDQLRRVAHGKGLRLELWVEGGLGAQLIRWYGDGNLVRPDLELAIGGELTIRGAHRHAGVFIGVRTLLSPTPDPVMATPAACAATCESPGRPTSLTGLHGVDQSVLLTVAVNLGG